MNSQRVPITRRGKEIGFFEAPLPQEAFATLPNLEGDTLGLGIVVEIDEAPAAALILPRVGESIEVATPIHWSPETPLNSTRIETRQPSNRWNPKGAAGIIEFVGVVATSKGGFDVEVSTQPERPFRGIPFRLELDDESEAGLLHLHLRADEPYGRGFGRLRLRAESRSADFSAFFDFRGEGSFGYGEGRLHGRLRSEKGEMGRGEFTFDMDFVEIGRGFGEGRCRYSGTTEFPALKLIQSITRAATSGEPHSLRLWVGWLKYASTPEIAIRERRHIAALLASESPPSALDIRAVADWVVSVLPHLESVDFQRAIAPFRERIPPRLSRPQKPRGSTRELTLSFDASVPASKALEFLIALARNLDRAGARVCLAAQSEES